MPHVKYNQLKTSSGCSSPDAAKLRKSLFTLKVICHPVRFRILLGLADGPRHAEQLKQDMHVTAGFLSSYLTPLQHAGLVKTCQHENCKGYCLTEIGLKTARYVLDVLAASCEPASAAEVEAGDAPIVALDGKRRLPDRRSENNGHKTSGDSPGVTRPTEQNGTVPTPPPRPR